MNHSLQLRNFFCVFCEALCYYLEQKIEQTIFKGSNFLEVLLAF
jgi:hypothetical protein